MKITYTPRWREGSVTQEVTSLLKEKLYGEGEGAVESAQATADNCAAAIARLTEVLHSREPFTPAEVLHIAGVCHDETKTTKLE